ncbi:MAG: VOC family protein [Neomegalonema sp.]|nr:VOC family protein [Neomegalonema sp.]
MKMNPYLSFDGRCDEAFALYRQVLGGAIEQKMVYEGSPGEGMVPDDFKSKTMHAAFVTGDIVLMGSDQPPERYQKPQGVYVSLQVETPEEAERIFAALSEGGEIIMPMGEAFWARRFGMFVDRFNIGWMINCE